MRDFDVLIVGAGVVGATMASLLVARKLAAPGRVAIVAERFAPAYPMPESEWDLRVFALSRASQRLLKVSGAWANLPSDKMAAYERMRVWDARGEPRGRGSLGFDCAELGEPNLGFIVEGRALQHQTLRAAVAAGVVCIEAAVAGVAVGESGVRVSLGDGRELGSQLLIAADGTASRTREPLPDGRSSIVWSMARAEAARLRALDAAAFGAALTSASGEVLGCCELTTPVASFPLKLQYALDYVGPRAVLLGDAAHAVHPLAGQGLNLGLLDCAALTEVLSEGGAAGFFGEHKLLRRYERSRRSENLLAAAALDGLERLFSGDDPLRMRMAGLGLVDRVPFIKRQLAERALGLTGDLPGFLRGEAGASGLKADRLSRRR